ncbi:hypothetical protein [Dendronalium phyllosphericum]|nr:hypothetical protein [Dendronalium phyllosphericum]
MSRHSVEQLAVPTGAEVAWKSLLPVLLHLLYKITTSIFIITLSM